MSRESKTGRPSFLAPASPVPQPPYPVMQAPYYPPAPQGQGSLPTAFEVRVEAIPDPYATSARATLATVTGPRGYQQLAEATGSSQRAPGDEYDEETGTLYAVSRALAALARQLRRQADARVKHADDVREHRESRRREGPYQGRHEKPAGA